MPIFQRHMKETPPTPARLRAWAAYYQRNKYSPDVKKRKREHDIAYRRRAGDHPRKEWERWEEVLTAIERERGTPYRQIAFALGRGFDSVYQKARVVQPPTAAERAEHLERECNGRG